MSRDDRQQTLDDDRRQAEAHLVDEQTPRFRHQRPGDGEHLLLTTREQASEALAQRLQRREQLEGAIAGGAARAAIAGETEPDVLVHREVEEQRTVLGDVGETSSRHEVSAVAVDGFTEHLDGATERCEQPGDGQQRRRLAGPVRAEEGDDLTGCDREIQVADDGDAAVAGVDAAQLDQRCVHHAPSPCCVSRCVSRCVSGVAPSTWALSSAPTSAWASPADSPR